MVNTTADGSLDFSIIDLARWDAALRRKALTSIDLEQMWSVAKLNNDSRIPATTVSAGLSNQKRPSRC